METIEQFLAGWKERAFLFYMDTIRKGIEIERKHTSWVSAEQRSFKEEHAHWKSTVAAFWNENRTAKSFRDWGTEKAIRARLEKVLSQEVESKHKSLVTRVEKKVGQILDATGLFIGVDGGINGFVMGTKGRVEVQTVYAGGYNIQRLHYRVLVKASKEE